MSRTPARFDAAAVREALPLAPLLASLGVTITRGRGPCPFCGTSNRSQAIQIRRDEEHWHCYACGRGGDVITAVQLAEGLTFPQALARAAALGGVQAGTKPPPRREDPARTRRVALGEAFRFLAAVRDRCRMIARETGNSMDVRGDALAAAVAAQRQMDQLLGDETWRQDCCLAGVQMCEG